MNTAIDTEYIILENIYDSAESAVEGQGPPARSLRQRDLAQIAGASLGMTNFILKRLVQKGWIKAKRINCRNIQYAVTLEGINEIISRSYRYFKRTIKNVVFFKEILEDLVNTAKQNNIKKVTLVGASDLDFIVEHACRRSGLIFARTGENEKSSCPPSSANVLFGSDTLVIYAEGISVNKKIKNLTTPENTFFLSRLIIKQAAELGGNTPLR
jgi:hypothetical protein